MGRIIYWVNTVSTPSIIIILLSKLGGSKNKSPYNGHSMKEGLNLCADVGVCFIVLQIERTCVVDTDGCCQYGHKALSAASCLVASGIPNIVINVAWCSGVEVG